MISLHEIRKLDRMFDENLGSYMAKGLAGKVVLIYRSGEYVEYFFDNRDEAIAHLRGPSGGVNGQTYLIRRIPVPV